MACRMRPIPNDGSTTDGVYLANTRNNRSHNRAHNRARITECRVQRGQSAQWVQCTKCTECRAQNLAVPRAHVAHATHFWTTTFLVAVVMVSMSRVSSTSPSLLLNVALPSAVSCASKVLASLTSWSKASSTSLYLL